MNQEISPTRAARGLLFMSISFFFVWLINTGKLEHIVHPRMEPWIIAAGLVFFVLSFYQTVQLASAPRRADPLSHFYPFVLVFGIAYLFVTTAGFQPEPFQAAPSLAIQTALVSGHEAEIHNAGKGPLPSRIVFDDSTYWTLYNRLYDDPKAALGKEIRVAGFLYRKKGFPEDSVLIARNLMWCCSADMSMIGFLARSSAPLAIPDGTWVEAEGRLGSIDYDVAGSGKKSAVPLIMLDSINPARRSASTIIYPY
ncbi:MAG: TIGR03943 family protein [Treponema sp.]|nr:TIGR03943 family protein [Treponema sp.]